MSDDLLQTKLYMPRLRPSLVSRPRLIQILDQGLTGKLTLISAPAGFGKTTLIRCWIDALQAENAPTSPQIAWLSLDENDGATGRFLSYVIAALQRIDPNIGESAQPMLPASPLPVNTILTAVLNDISSQPHPLMLVLDDYHVLDARQVDEALAFLLDHLPPQLHLVITTREDPNLPLARLRVRGWLTELRSADLRFAEAETAVFLQQVMGLDLTEEQIAALEARTEGWIAGLQMAALSMRGQEDVSGFIQSFTGSHRFVLDYLLEEVLDQQPAPVQEFLLKTAVLNQLSGPLCDALTGKNNGQQILESLDRSNLFLVPLDNERRWYRYHHLFSELLRQRLQQTAAESDINDLHIRAGAWYEANGLELEAFHHAAIANDIERALRVIEGGGLPLYFRGEVIPVRQWLESLPESEFEARPALWVTYASVLTLTGRLQDNIEVILQKAETALQDTAPGDRKTDLMGQIAANRAMLGIVKNEVDKIITQSRLALELLHPDNAHMRTTTTWTLGYAYQIQGNRSAALEAYTETITQSQKSGNLMTEIAATTCIGQIQETENQLHQAEETFRGLLGLLGEPLWPGACEACVGLARIHHQWNDLENAQKYGEQALELALQLENVDTPAACNLLLARIKLAEGDTDGVLRMLAEVERFVQERGFGHWMGEITAVRIQTYRHQNNLTAAQQLDIPADQPFNQARLHLAQNETAAALAVLEPVGRQAEENGWHDQWLRALLLQALAYWQQGEKETAVRHLQQALSLAKPGGLIRAFVDEGPEVAHLLYEALTTGIEPTYVQQILAAFPEDGGETAVPTPPPAADQLLEPLSEREIEVLQFIGQGLTNQEVANRLFLSLHTVKVHARNIYGKLGVKNRTQAVAKARTLGILETFLTHLS